GGSGFVGRHVVRSLAAGGAEVVAPGRSELDVARPDAVGAAVRDIGPAAIVHLAGFASVQRSWRAPEEPLLGNLGMTLNVVEAARGEAPEAAVVIASSGEIYGAPG